MVETSRDLSRSLSKKELTSLQGWMLYGCLRLKNRLCALWLKAVQASLLESCFKNKSSLMFRGIWNCMREDAAYLYKYHGL